MRVNRGVLTSSGLIVILLVLCVFAFFVPVAAPRSWGAWGFSPITFLVGVLVGVLVDRAL